LPALEPGARGADRALGRARARRGRRLAREHDRLRPPEPLRAHRQRAVRGGGDGGVFTYKKVYVNGVEQPQAPNGSETGEDAKTDIGWFTVGDGQFVTTPGELFPFTYAHSFQGPDDLPHPEFGGVHGWVMAAMNARWRFIEGL